jgi:hypothetical protein
MRFKKSHLKRGMWIFLGNTIVEGYNDTFLNVRQRCFDYRKNPLWERELRWHSQHRNPYRLTPQQVTGMSPLTCKFKSETKIQGKFYYKHTFRIKEISHIFNTHSEFIVWRNEFLKDERDYIKELHQAIRKDRTFWKARRTELRMWNRIDDLKNIRKIK